MNDILRIARLRIALQRAFLGRAILRVISKIAQNHRLGVKTAKIKVLSNGPTGPTKVFWACPIYVELLTIGKMGLSHQNWSHGESGKKQPKFPHCRK